MSIFTENEKRVLREHLWREHRATEAIRRLIWGKAEIGRGAWKWATKANATKVERALHATYLAAKKLEGKDLLDVSTDLSLVHSMLAKYAGYVNRTAGDEDNPHITPDPAKAKEARTASLDMAKASWDVHRKMGDLKGVQWASPYKPFELTPYH